MVDPRLRPGEQRAARRRDLAGQHRQRAGGHGPERDRTLRQRGGARLRALARAAQRAGGAADPRPAARAFRRAAREPAALRAAAGLRPAPRGHRRAGALRRPGARRLPDLPHRGEPRELGTALHQSASDLAARRPALRRPRQPGRRPDGPRRLPVRAGAAGRHGVVRDHRARAVRPLAPRLVERLGSAAPGAGRRGGRRPQRDVHRPSGEADARLRGAGDGGDRGGRWRAADQPRPAGARGAGRPARVQRDDAAARPTPRGVHAARPRAGRRRGAVVLGRDRAVRPVRPRGEQHRCAGAERLLRRGPLARGDARALRRGGTAASRARLRASAGGRAVALSRGGGAGD